MPNADPRVDTIEVAHEGEDFTPREPDVPVQVGVGETIAVRIGWAQCEEGTACTGAETYVHFDPIDLELGTRREALSIAWFAGAGSFADARTGRADDDTERESVNEWTAPEDAGLVYAWIVIEDERGGVSWSSLGFDVQ